MRPILFCILGIMLGLSSVTFAASKASKEAKVEPKTTAAKPVANKSASKTVKPEPKNITPSQPVFVEPLVSNKSDVPVLPQNLENKVIDNLFQNSSFPEKSEYILKEDQTRLGKSALQPQVADTFSTAKLFWTSLFMGLLVVGLGFLWRYLQQRFVGRIDKKLSGLNVVGQHFITHKSRLLVIDCLGRKLLIGATESQIALLADLDYDTEQAQNLDNIQTRVDSSVKADSEELVSPAEHPPSSEFKSFLPVEKMGSIEALKEKLKLVKRL